MTRIIGGAAGGRHLATPPGSRTRPTGDRVREALFSSLEASFGGLDGLAFLDLYAGSGAVGLEAASRGAARVTLVEDHRRSAGVIRDNVGSLALRGVEVVMAPVLRAVAVSPRAAYDVVFMDPPYALPDPEVARVLATMLENGWVGAHGVVVVERPTRGGPFAWPAGYLGDRSRGYGQSRLWYGRCGPAAES